MPQFGRGIENVEGSEDSHRPRERRDPPVELISGEPEDDPRDDAHSPGDHEQPSERGDHAGKPLGAIRARSDPASDHSYHRASDTTSTSPAGPFTSTSPIDTDFPPRNFGLSGDTNPITPAVGNDSTAS
uniref:Uncharacterized protein n=1 Tax=Acrobeloides nanus TaxID=290746 RepID=A0A914CZ38_9BILA